MLTNGQIGQLLHFFIPALILFGLDGAGSGTFALISLSFRSVVFYKQPEEEEGIYQPDMGLVSLSSSVC